MLTVEGIIGDLLLQHNCVIVPTFGGFVTQRVGAQLDAVNGTMTPPRKAILFNRQLINNDGLLIATFSHQNNVPYNEAQAAVSNAVSLWDNQLKLGQRISIDRVGFLYLDQERNLCFEQDRFYNLLMESYGLGAIHFVSSADVEAKIAHEAIQELVRETLTEPLVEFQPSNIEVVAEETHNEVPVIAINMPKKPARVWRYAAAAAILPIVFYSLWIPMKTDVLESGMLSLSDFNPFHQKTAPAYQPSTKTYTIPQREVPQSQLDNIPEGVSVFSFSLDDETFVPVRIPNNDGSVEVTNLEPVSQPTPTPVQVTPVSSSGSYIIVGCFSDVSNANQLVKTLRSKGFDAKTLPGGNLTRVSAGDGAQFNELNPKLKAEGLAGWVLK
ncbi:MAG: SPOR domain-containing protein [Fluviicola sp.]|nr:SPOR domain-containing protein [Fluviicola sp.]